MSNSDVAAAQFCTSGRIVDVRPYGEGNLNDTYLVTLEGAPHAHLILQRINTHVFQDPHLIMLNLRIFSDHVQQRLAHEGGGREPRWVVPAVLQTVDGDDYYLDPAGGFWRALGYVEGSRCFQTVQSIDHAREAGYALGRFHSLISDLDPALLHDTLEGFHITPRYLQHYDRVVSSHSGPQRSVDVAHAMRFVQERRAWASVLEDAKASGELFERPIHGDPKINNIMIDEHTGRAVSIVDLDTIKPGLVHYDIGDCLRSCCNPLGEETTEIEGVDFDLELCQAILEGYLGEAQRFMTGADYAYLYDAVRLIAFELGLRFFTDYLEGDVYFKARYPGHNLMRALVQFKVAESIEAQADQIEGIVAALRPQ
ncbi:MAG: phosphotransferase enzyme family protein [Anaerolineae bacterium]